MGVTHTLDEFAAGDGGRRQSGWMDKLPDEIQTQILDSDAGHAVVERWLHSLGFEEATQQKIGHWRNHSQRAKDHRAGRG